MSDTPKEGNSGAWNAIRETVVCTMTDLTGREFNLRFLVDTGATISSIPAYTLYYTKAKWDCEQIRPIPVAGINSVTDCDIICHAPIKPGKHLSKEFLRQWELPHNFVIDVDFYVLRGPEVYTTFKSGLPSHIISTLSSQKYQLADPAQLEPNDSLLYIHGILGVRAITKMRRTTIQEVPGTDLTICRSVLGDLLFGTSHFRADRMVTVDPPMNDNNARENEKHSFSSEMISRGAVVEEDSKNVDDESISHNDWYNL
jgi:hypothetical protein